MTREKLARIAFLLDYEGRVEPMLFKIGARTDPINHEKTARLKRCQDTMPNAAMIVHTLA